MGKEITLSAQGFDVPLPDGRRIRGPSTSLRSGKIGDEAPESFDPQLLLVDQSLLKELPQLVVDAMVA